jgi:L-histidine N-alpha-methyltransferase
MSTEMRCARDDSVQALDGKPAVRLRCDRFIDERGFVQAMTEDVLRGLAHTPKSLPPRYFYDEAGCALFERITRLPEYYLTRVEEELLRSLAPALMRELKPQDIVEIGSGSSIKIRHFLDALAEQNGAVRYVPMDVNAPVAERAARKLTQDYPNLWVHAIAGDFERHLGCVPPAQGRRLVTFFGSTIGNLGPLSRREFLLQVRALMRPSDRFLLGLDLVKDRAVLEAAYNDCQGVTAEFNRNILRVINRQLGANFDPAAFAHRAFYQLSTRCIEMHLVSTRSQTVFLSDSKVAFDISSGESILTENSYKFTRRSSEQMLREAGMGLEAWFTDAQSRFALALVSVRDGSLAR